jgi:hypothetical protein
MKNLLSEGLNITLKSKGCCKSSLIAEQKHALRIQRNTIQTPI